MNVMKIFLLLLIICDGLVAEEMNKFVVKNSKSREATCNDGTPSIYYVRKIEGSTKWLIFLQGGGGCYDESSCNERYKNDKFLMSSDSPIYKPTLTVDGLCSDDCKKNPAYCSYNMIFIEYCTSDWWSGNNTKSGWFVFLGKNVINAVIEDAMEDHGMKTATDVVLSGGSAGGVGALSNSDYVGEIIGRYISNVTYSVVSDCGWFLDGEGYEKYTCKNNEFCNYQTRMMTGISMWNFVPHEECGKYFEPKGMLWRCLVGYNVYNFIKARKFAMFYIFDKWQASQDFDKWKSSVSSMTSKEKAWVTNRGVEIYKSIVDDKMKDNGGVLALGCFDHVMSIIPAYYMEKALNGQYINEIIHEFEQGGSPYVWDACHGVENCNPSCLNK